MPSVAANKHDSVGSTEGQVPDKLLLMWCNEQLKSRQLKIEELNEDLKDGVKLINILEVATGKACGKYVKQPRMEIQRYDNTQMAFDFMSSLGVKLVNIGNTDVVDGNPKLVRGLIWTLMEHYQFGRPYADAKNVLLEWVQSKIPEYNITRFGQQWNDGRALCALVNSISPGTCPDHANLDSNAHIANVNKGMELALDLYKIPRIIEAEDMANPHVPEPLLVTYLSYFVTANPVHVNHAARAHASGPGLKDGVAHKESFFRVQAPGAGSADLQVRIEGPDNACRATISDRGNGDFDVNFTPTLPGDYLLHVTLAGEPVPGSAFHVRVADDNAVASTTAHGPGLVEGMATVPADFTVVAPRTGSVEIRVKGPALCGLDPEIVDNGDGTYSCRSGHAAL